MGLDITLSKILPTTVHSSHITHNLTAMAGEAGIYKLLWRPEEVGVDKAHHFITPLRTAIAEMEANPERFKKHNSPNGWGTYENFLPWLKELLRACEKHQDATISISR